MPQLHGFFRSGTSHRVRIALNLKGIAYESFEVDLRSDVHRSAAFLALNPQGLVPVLVSDGITLTQSPAILEWVEETYPSPPLLPQDPIARARVRAIAAIIGCDVHPINNRRILNVLRERFGATEDSVKGWCAQWIRDGFDAAEALLAEQSSTGEFSAGNEPSLAEVYLIPQIESARRFDVDVARWPRLAAIDAACSRLDAFRRAAPSAQPAHATL